MYVHLATAAAVVVASVVDIAMRTRRDWLHWFGVGVTLVAFIVNPMIEVATSVYGE